MREFETFRGCRRTLLGAASVIAAACAANPALAESGPEGSEETPGIVIRDGFNPNTPPPGGILDAANVNGVGQVVRDAGGGSVGTCTGTLINPRTVIFAAHCVNTQAASSYGGNTGGTGVMVGFQNNTLAGIRQWLGLDGGTRYATNTATATYNVEQIWYDPRSLAPGSNGFLQADVAIATLDTPAFDIPTWAMLFTPLDGQGHVTVTGYGSTGTHSSVMASGTTASGGFRRRVAENYVSLLGSMADRNSVIFGSPSGGLNQNLYMVSFTDPNPGYNPSVGKFDFGIFGPNDVALPREGTTAPGDSGGPLILDQKYDRPVVLGVLSGGSRFFGAQPFSTYGTHSFYQPLYAFWDLIVANNPYVYATNKEGDGEWTDASHWVQAMDPNYMIDLNGQLINGVPDTPGIGIDAGGAKFGQVCFLTNCQTLTSNPAEGDGTPHFVEGGPGSVNFVPNNVSANPQQGIKSRYYLL
jgi:subtilase-type serine protease